MVDVVINRCKYYLPCGLCDLSHERCKQDEPIVAYEPCEHQWWFCGTRTDPNETLETRIFKCLKCGKLKYVHKSLEE